ncbi:MAG: prepilin peptidase [Campylobacter sp.]|nr:prepilin peptidase [Campylobacter sp.]
MLFLAILYFILGVCVGSFANVLIYRLPIIEIKKTKKKNGECVDEIESIALPSSHCMSCGTPLKWYHNIPIFSWLALGGKCAFCKSKISSQYPIVEFISGLLMLFAFLNESGSFEYLELFKALMLGLLFIILLAMSLIDLRYTAAPTLLLNTSVILSLLYAFSLQGIINASILAGIFALIALTVSLIKKRGVMGSADIYIFACIGSVLGLNLGFFAIFIAALLTLPAYFIAAKSEYELPFIPFLSLGLFIVYCFDDKWLEVLNFIYG